MIPIVALLLAVLNLGILAGYRIRQREETDQ